MEFKNNKTRSKSTSRSSSNSKSRSNSKSKSKSSDSEDEFVSDNIEDNEIIAFWKPYFGNNKSSARKIMEMKEKIQAFIYNPYACQWIQHLIPTFAVLNMDIQQHLCYSFLIIGALTKVLDGKYTLLLKGGKAVQMALYNIIKNADHIPSYKSDDIDLVVLAEKGATHSTQKMAAEIARFIIWVSPSNQLTGEKIYASRNQPVMSTPDSSILLSGSIVKVSLTNGKRFIAVLDIGYVIPDHADIFHSKIDKNRFRIDYLGLDMTFYNVNIKYQILEKLHYIIKYISKTSRENRQLNKFRDSLYKSINVLFDGLILSEMKLPKISEIGSPIVIPAQLRDDILGKYLDIYVDKLMPENKESELENVKFPDGVKLDDIIKFIFA